MLPGLSSLDLGRLKMSVGYGTHKRGRPLSPVEVGTLLRRTCAAGSTLGDCANALSLDCTTQLSRFLRILDLPPDLRHLVAWGRSRDSIGFTTAVELVRVPDAEDQRAIANAILEEALQTSEVRQVAQLRQRSHRPVEECIQEVLGMRPVVERRYVFIGAVGDDALQATLASMTQTQRDQALKASIEATGLTGASGRLGEQLFTLVGDDRFNEALSEKGRTTIEAELRARIAESVRNAHSEG